MKIDITAKNLDLTPSLEAYIYDKLGSLERFIEKYEDLGELRLRVTIERVTAHHHKGEVFRASADIVFLSRNFYAEETDEDVRTAIDGVRSRLHAEINKHKPEH